MRDRRPVPTWPIPAAPTDGELIMGPPPGEAA